MLGPLARAGCKSRGEGAIPSLPAVQATRRASWPTQKTRRGRQVLSSVRRSPGARAAATGTAPARADSGPPRSTPRRRGHQRRHRMAWHEDS